MINFSGISWQEHGTVMRWWYL